MLHAGRCRDDPTRLRASTLMDAQATIAHGSCKPAAVCVQQCIGDVQSGCQPAHARHRYASFRSSGLRSAWPLAARASVSDTARRDASASATQRWAVEVIERAEETLRQECSSRAAHRRSSATRAGTSCARIAGCRSTTLPASSCAVHPLPRARVIPSSRRSSSAVARGTRRHSSSSSSDGRATQTASTSLAGNSRFSVICAPGGLTM